MSGLPNIRKRENSVWYVDYQHAIKIAREIADFTKLRRSPSFQRFALKVAALEL